MRAGWDTKFGITWFETGSLQIWDRGPNLGCKIICSLWCLMGDGIDVLSNSPFIVKINTVKLADNKEAKGLMAQLSVG